MDKSLFIERIKHAPWVDRACSFTACDCWGLVVLYYRHVLGIELHQIPGYESGRDFVTCHSSEVVYWQKTPLPAENSVFVGYVGGRAQHVGVVVDGAGLHSRGCGGGVMHTRLRVIEKMFTRVEYLTHADYRNTACSGPAEGAN